MRYAFPELRTMDIAAHVLEEEIHMMNMDPSQRPLEMAIEGVGDFINKIWESIKKIFTAIPNLCKKLIEKIKDSKLIASRRVNKAENLPASASKLSSEKLAKFKNYRSEIDSSRRKLMHKTRDCMQAALKNCDDFNNEIVPVLQQVDSSTFLDITKCTKYNEKNIADFRSRLDNDKKLLSECKNMAEQISQKLHEFSNVAGDDKLFGEWVPDYSDDDNYETFINELSTKSTKYLEQVKKMETKFNSFLTGVVNTISRQSKTDNSAYKLLQLYQENAAICNEIIQTYTSVASVVYSVFKQGVTDKTSKLEDMSATGWVWNDKDKNNAHWDYVAKVRLKSGKLTMLTYAYNNERDKSQKPTRDLKKVHNDIINDFNNNHSKGDPAKSVVGAGDTVQSQQNDEHQNQIKHVRLKGFNKNLTKNEIEQWFQKIDSSGKAGSITYKDAKMLIDEIKNGDKSNEKLNHIFDNNTNAVKNVSRSQATKDKEWDSIQKLLSTEKEHLKNAKSYITYHSREKLSPSKKPGNVVESAYLTDEMYERALEYVYDYGMPFEDAVEAVLEEVEAEENSYIDAAVESLFADEFDDIDHSKAYYQEDDEDRWDNFLT